MTYGVQRLLHDSLYIGLPFFFKIYLSVRLSVTQNAYNSTRFFCLLHKFQGEEVKEKNNATLLSQIW